MKKREGEYICIVRGDDAYDIDSFVLEFLVFFDVRREMLDLASRRKRPWNCKQHHLLPHEFLPNQSKARYPFYSPSWDFQDKYLLGVKVDGHPAGSDFACLRCVGDVLEFRGRKLVADFQGSHCYAIDGCPGACVEGVSCGERESRDGGLEVVPRAPRSGGTGG